MKHPNNLPDWPYKLRDLGSGKYSLFIEGRGHPYPRFSNWDDAINGMIALYKKLPDSMFEDVLFNSALQGQSEIFKVKTIQELLKCLNGTHSGQGTLTFADGNKYVGEWTDNKFNGQGTLTFVSGSKYIGEFKDGKRHGQGTYTYVNGNKYVGEWKDDKFNGPGTNFYLAENQFKGDQYVGEFKKGQELSKRPLQTPANIPRRDYGDFKRNKF